MTDALSLFLATRNPQRVELERFRGWNPTGEHFSSDAHRKMVAEHNARKSIRANTPVHAPAERPAIPVRREPVLSAERLRLFRVVAEQIRNDRKLQNG